jgi:hypothetical protein
LLFQWCSAFLNLLLRANNSCRSLLLNILYFALVRIEGNTFRNIEAKVLIGSDEREPANHWCRCRANLLRRRRYRKISKSFRLCKFLMSDAADSFQIS